MKKIIKITTMNIVVLAVFLFLLEAGYRINSYFFGSFSDLDRFKVTEQAFGVYDEKYGVRYPPNVTWTRFTVNDGKTTWCPDVIYRSNKDGLSGRTTIDKYNDADVKILVFGDSFTNWNRKGYTWPDLLEETLSAKPDRDVGILNFARGGYGVLQMFDLAADMVEIHKPDLAVIAFIGDDLTRDRWWTKTLMIDGYERRLQSTKKDDFDLSIAKDQIIVNPSVNLDWCKAALNSDKKDAVTDSVMRQYQAIRKTVSEYHNFPSILAADQSFLFNKLFRGRPFARRRGIPRIGIDDFREDRQLVEKAEIIRKHNIPVQLIYLPSHREVKKDRIVITDQSETLLNSLEEIMGVKTSYLFEYFEQYDLPEAIDMRPHDLHPNFEGLQLYAAAISDLLVEKDLFREPGQTSADRP